MKRTLAVLITSLTALTLALPSLAGPDGKKCKEETQSCLNHMASYLKGRGWLGIEMDESDAGIKITKVVKGSPAEAAGFQVGDRLVSVNGARFADNTEEKCATCEATKDVWIPGASVTYVVGRAGGEATLKPTLAAMPPEVAAQIVGSHMLEHAQYEVAKK